MQSNGWVKHFITGSSLEGLDKDVPSGKCSWSRSRLSGMIGCELHHEGKTLQISGDGIYHQSDDLKALFMPGETVKSDFVKRRLQFQIRECDTHIFTSADKNHLHVYVKQSIDDKSEWVKLEPKDAGKWLTVELDVESQQISWSIKEKI